MKRWVVVLIVALAVGLFGWGVTRARAQHSEDMDMMMKMMMNRPKALKQADMTVQTQKKKLLKAGKYGCCLKHPCDLCALKMGACPCGMNAASDKPVCNECKGGWYAGDGAIAGKTPDQIKTMPRMDMKMGEGRESGVRTASTDKIVDVWHCPITGGAITDHKGVGEPAVVGKYRVHFCCGGCPESFAKLSDADKLTKTEAAVKKDGNG